MDPLRLLIVADDPLARAGLALLLADMPALDIVGQLHSDEVDDELPHLTPDLLLWDLGWETAVDLPDWSTLGVPVMALLAEESDPTPVWSAGARALLGRELEGEKVAAAAETAANGLIVLDPVLAQNLLPAPTDLTPPLTDELTPREQEVLQLLAEGLTNKAIGQRLEISDHTVKFHVNAIMGKLAAQSRTEAVVRATRLGLIVL